MTLMVSPLAKGLFARAIGEYGSIVFISGNVPFKTEIAPYLIVMRLEEYDYTGAIALAVVMAVAHDALPIAVLGVIGGFLSPVIFSSGGNHPYGLFCYVILVDSVALGAAYFRRWRALLLGCGKRVDQSIGPEFH